MDRKTRKLIIIYGGLHPRSCIDRLCIPRCDGGRGLVSVEDCVEEEKCNLGEYAAQSKEALVKTLAAELNFEKYIVSVSKKEKKENRLKELKQKTLHGQFVRETECRIESRKWGWFREGELKSETKSLLCAAQEQAIRTNSMKYSIDKTSETPCSRLCNENVESVTNIISVCPSLAKNQY